MSRRQHRAIVALLAERTIREAAAVAGVSEATLRRWMKIEEFVAEYRNARRAAVSMAIARLQQNSATAVDVLKEVMEDTEAPSSVRVSAAKTVIELTLRATETEDLAVRVALLEEIANL